MKEIDPLIGAYVHLENYPQPEWALRQLQRIASLVKPIMRKRGWKVRTFGEFYPPESLLGINVNHGEAIYVRLRYFGDTSKFMPLETVVDTMLHELCHIVRSPHDNVFHKLWNELRDEYDDLKLKGYTGEGFLGAGQRVGGVATPVQELQRQARAAAERRKAEAVKSKGSGQKLGGKPISRTTDIRRIIANAADRRRSITQGCAAGSNDTDRLVQQALRNGFRTPAEEHQANERAIAEALQELAEEGKEWSSDTVSSEDSDSGTWFNDEGGLSWNPDTGVEPANDPNTSRQMPQPVPAWRKSQKRSGNNKKSFGSSSSSNGNYLGAPTAGSRAGAGEISKDKQLPPPPLPAAAPPPGASTLLPQTTYDPNAKPKNAWIRRRAAARPTPLRTIPSSRMSTDSYNDGRLIPLGNPDRKAPPMASHPAFRDSPVSANTNDPRAFQQDWKPGEVNGGGHGHDRGRNDSVSTAVSAISSDLAPNQTPTGQSEVSDSTPRPSTDSRGTLPFRPSSLAYPEPVEPDSPASMIQVEKEWNCPVCTLCNPGTYLCCEACGNARPFLSNITDFSSLGDLGPDGEVIEIPDSPTELPASYPHGLRESTMQGHDVLPASSYSSPSSAYSPYSPQNSNKGKAPAAASSAMRTAQSLAAAAGPSDDDKGKRRLGWVCSGCGTFMEEKWWTCSNCSKIKDSS